MLVFGLPHGTFLGNLHTLIHFSSNHLVRPVELEGLAPAYFPPFFLYSFTSIPLAYAEGQALTLRLISPLIFSYNLGLVGSGDLLLRRLDFLLPIYITQTFYEIQRTKLEDLCLLSYLSTSVNESSRKIHTDDTIQHSRRPYNHPAWPTLEESTLFLSKEVHWRLIPRYKIDIYGPFHSGTCIPCIAPNLACRAICN